VADRLVCVDGEGKPYIRGDAVKGALRMSAAQVLEWLRRGRSDRSAIRSEDTGGAAYGRLFGGRGHAHFEAGRLMNTHHIRALASTAIDKESGVARDDHLRQVQIVDAGARFRCKCTWWVPDPLAEPVRTLAVAALLTTESVGGRAGVGWGQVRVVDGEGTTGLTAVVGERRLMALLDPAPSPQPPAIRARPAAGDKVWYRLDITLEEPACFTRLPDLANQIATQDAIPATTLRGAFHAVWRRADAGDDEIQQWLGEGTRWSPGFPADAEGRPCVPVPLSFRRVKGQDGFASPDGLRDGLCDESPPSTVIRGGHEERLRWMPVEIRWMQFQPAEKAEGRARIAPRRLDGAIDTHMHVARNDVTGSKATGMLFTRESLLPVESARHHVAWVHAPRGCPFGEAAEVFLGKRTSAGYGRATVEVTPGEAPKWPAASDEKSVTVRVQLLSHALVLGREGLPLRTLKPDDWADLLPDVQRDDFDPKGTRARSAAVLVGGWMVPWGHLRAGQTCIERGSVWHLQCSDAEAANRVRKALQAKVESGLGERVHEGFGWLVVDPPWLGGPVPPGGAGTGTDESENRRRAEAGSAGKWPGCEDGNPEEMRKIARDPAMSKVESSLQRPLQDLASRVRGRPDASKAVTGAMDWCGKMADRVKPQQWEPLMDGKPLRTILETAAHHPALFRFALQAMLIRARKPHREGE
jgi:hypothetical protein